MMGGSSGGSSSGGGFWGAIATAAIGAGSSLYSAKKAKDAQSDADSKMRAAQEEANQKQADALKESQDRTEAMNEENATRASEANTPIGESATLDFGQAGEYTGTSLDFLVPKIGNSQLGVKSSSGLGV